MPNQISNMKQRKHIYLKMANYGEVLLVVIQRTTLLGIFINFDALLQFQTFKFLFTPLTPMSDQDRISPYNINTITTR